MKVCLIYPPHPGVAHHERTNVENAEWGVFPPLNLSVVASIVRNAGHAVTLIDANALRLSTQETLLRLKEFNPNFLGFMLTSYMFQRTFDWIKYFKEQTSLPVAVGGINLTIFPKETLSHKEIDYGIIGPAIKSLPELLDAVENGKSIDHIKGLAFRQNGNLIINPAENMPRHQDELPFAARDLLPNHLYHSFLSQGKNFTIMVTSMGCPFNCVFCDEGGEKYYGRSPKNVVDEMEECVTRYNVKEIDIFDREFTIKKQRVLDICDEIIRRNLKVKWSCRARVTSVNEKMLAKMKKAGCKMIMYGIESGDPDILKSLNKGIDLDRIRQTVRWTQKYNIRVFGFFIIGSPGETWETALRTIRFARELNIDYAQFTRMTAKPKTPLSQMLVKEMGFDFWPDLILGKVKEQRLPMPWTELSQQEIDQLIKKAYLSVHLRPRCIFKTLINVRSFGELMRYFKVAVQMIVQRGTAQKQVHSLPLGGSKKVRVFLKEALN